MKYKSRHELQQDLLRKIQISKEEKIKKENHGRTERILKDKTNIIRNVSKSENDLFASKPKCRRVLKFSGICGTRQILNSAASRSSFDDAISCKIASKNANEDDAATDFNRTEREATRFSSGHPFSYAYTVGQELLSDLDAPNNNGVQEKIQKPSKVPTGFSSFFFDSNLCDSKAVHSNRLDITGSNLITTNGNEEPQPYMSGSEVKHDLSFEKSVLEGEASRCVSNVLKSGENRLKKYEFKSCTFVPHSVNEDNSTKDISGTELDDTSSISGPSFSFQSNGVERVNVDAKRFYVDESTISNITSKTANEDIDAPIDIDGTEREASSLSSGHSFSFQSNELESVESGKDLLKLDANFGSCSTTISIEDARENIPVKSKVCSEANTEVGNSNERACSAAFYRGSCPNVYFVTALRDHQWSLQSQTVYAVHSNHKALCFKIQSPCNVKYIADFSLLVWNNQLDSSKFNGDSSVWVGNSMDFLCRKVKDNEQVSNFPDRTAFIISDSFQADPAFLKHSGLLWTCQSCFKGNSYRGNLLKHFVKTKNSVEKHKLLNADNQQNIIWGHEKTTKKDMAWGEPSLRDKQRPLKMYGSQTPSKIIGEYQIKPILTEQVPVNNQLPAMSLEAMTSGSYQEGNQDNVCAVSAGMSKNLPDSCGNKIEKVCSFGNRSSEVYNELPENYFEASVTDDSGADCVKDGPSCLVCDKMFPHISSLKCHVKEHNISFSHYCEIFKKDLSSDLDVYTRRIMDDSKEEGIEDSIDWKEQLKKSTAGKIEGQVNSPAHRLTDSEFEGSSEDDCEEQLKKPTAGKGLSIKKKRRNEGQVSYPAHPLTDNECEDSSEDDCVEQFKNQSGKKGLSVKRKKRIGSKIPPVLPSTSDSHGQNLALEGTNFKDVNLRKSARLIDRVNFLQEDDIDDSDVDKDYKNSSESGFESSSEDDFEEQHRKPTVRKGLSIKKKKIIGSKIPEMLTELVDSADEEPLRKEIRDDRRKMMEEMLRKGSNNDVYEPDEEDLQFEKQLLIIPIQKGSAKYLSKKMKIPPEKRSLMEEGTILTGGDKIYQTQRAKNLRNVFRRLLGSIQSQQNKLFEGKLPNGRMKYRYLVAFGKSEWVQLSQNILDLIEGFVANSTKRKMFCAVKIVLMEIYKLANSDDGLCRFMRAIEENKENLDNVMKVAKQERKEFVDEVDRTLKTLAMTKFHTKCTMDQEMNTEIVREGREKFESAQIPDPQDVVHKYLESDYVRNLEKMIFDLTSRNEKASPEFIKECTDHMLLRLALKGGNRSDLFSNLKLSDLARALEKGYAAYPFKKLHISKQVPESSLELRDGEDWIYVNSDPWTPDENDDSKDQDHPEWESLKGFCITGKQFT